MGGVHMNWLTPGLLYFVRDNFCLSAFVDWERMDLELFLGKFLNCCFAERKEGFPPSMLTTKGVDKVLLLDLFSLTSWLFFLSKIGYAS